MTLPARRPGRVLALLKARAWAAAHPAAHRLVRASDIEVPCDE
ncbi:hypothetical protein ACIP4X_29830 [Streptomyces sp. NPDC088817]